MFFSFFHNAPVELPLTGSVDPQSVRVKSGMSSNDPTIRLSYLYSIFMMRPLAPPSIITNKRQEQKGAPSASHLAETRMLGRRSRFIGSGVGRKG